MYLEVLQAGKALVTHPALVRLLVRVRPDVDEHFVPGIEAATLSGTPLPPTPEICVGLLDPDMVIVDMRSKLPLAGELPTTSRPSTHQGQRGGTCGLLSGVWRFSSIRLGRGER